MENSNTRIRNQDSSPPQSDEESIFSDKSDESNLTAFSTYGFNDADEAISAFVAKLCNDTGLRELYSHSVEKFQKQQFSEHHNKLLKYLFQDIWHITADRSLQDVIKFLRTTTKRAWTTYAVFRKFDETRPNQRQGPEDIGLPLLSQTPEVIGDEKRPESPVRWPNPESPLKTGGQDEESDKSENDDGEYENDPRQNELAKKAATLIITGPPFETFKLSLACLVNPESAIHAVLSEGSPQVLTRVLRRDFDGVTEGEYSWLRGLLDLGYNFTEIAELLFEDASDSPWIFYSSDSELTNELEVDMQRHLPGCVHQLSLSGAPKMPVTSDNQDPDNAISKIQRLCGLAGITPSSRNREDCNKSAVFEEENTIATVSYAHLDSRSIVSRVRNVLQHLYAAIGQAQFNGLCCESFTVLRHPARIARRPSDDSMVEACRIHFSLVSQLLEEFESFPIESELQGPEIPPAAGVLVDLFLESSGKKGPIGVLHLYSLLAQVLSLGFLSYVQGHIGHLHPSFLDTPIKRVRLLGCQTSSHPYPYIEASCQELTCISNMLQGPVLVFTKVERLRTPDLISSHPVPQKFDLLINSEDLIDMWGPGWFIKSSVDSQFAFAIRIGGGVIFCLDRRDKRFHWSRDELPDTNDYYHEFDMTTKIRIGASAVVNTQCPLDEGEYRSQLLPSLRPLGTYQSSWSLKEFQMGVQLGGPNVLVQALSALHRVEGRTLKTPRLALFDKRDEEVLPLLEDYWGVQLSMCTRVARRVSLREMVADLIPIFANYLTSQDDFRGWETLRDTHHILNVFQNEDLTNWLRGLDTELRDLVLRLIRHIFEILRHTGLDHESKSLLVAWPYEGDIHHCLAINLKPSANAWAHLIADSDDCATFAYVSPKCLESGAILCKGAVDSPYEIISLLETVVIACPPSNPRKASAATKTLCNKERYYFQKFGNKYFVRAEMSANGAAAKLVSLDRVSSIPPRFMQRISARETRLRERRGLKELGENVVLLTSATVY